MKGVAVVEEMVVDVVVVVSKGVVVEAEFIGIVKFHHINGVRFESVELRRFIKLTNNKPTNRNIFSTLD
jgi:hypothetical protein